MLTLSDDERLDRWESLIDTIDKTDIPIAFVKKINIVFLTPVDNVSEQDIDIDQLRDLGWTNDHLDEIVEQVFKDHDNNIEAVHFFLDVNHVADVVQQQTNILLEGMR